ncbi:hypothetical protein Q7689_27855, partial [Nocardiopsis tropica]|nr:hypothetical protein [Nocardiopsis tropica]
PGLPAPLVAALARALARDPGNRYADAEGFAAARAPDGGGAAGAAVAAAPAHGGVPDAPGAVPPPPPPVAAPGTVTPGAAPGPGTAPPAGDDTADPWQGLVAWEPPRAAPAPPPAPPAPAFGAGTPDAAPAAQAPFGPATGGPAADRAPVPPPGARDAGETRSRWLRRVQVAVSATAIVVIAPGQAPFVNPGPVAALLAAVGLVEPGADPAPAPVDPSSAPHAAISREAAPSDVAMEDSGDTVVLTWTDNAGEGTPHHVVGGPAGEAYAALAEVEPGAAEARVSGLDAAGQYCFVVIAVLSADEVAPSEEVCTERGTD